MKRVAGVDIGSFAIKAVEIEYDSKSLPRISNFGLVTLPNGAVVGGEIRDAAAVTASIKRLWNQGKFSSTEVVVGASGSRVFIRDLELPKMTEQELKGAMTIEAAQFLPGDINEYRVDYESNFQMKRVPRGNLDYMHLVAGDVEVLSEYEVAVAAANLRLAAIDSSFIALFRTVSLLDEIASGSSVSELLKSSSKVVRFPKINRVKADKGDSSLEANDSSNLDSTGDSTDLLDALADPMRGRSSQVIVIVVVGADKVSVGIAEDGMLTVARSLDDIGGDLVTKSIAREFSVDLATAEAIKRSLGAFSDVNEEIDADIDPKRLRTVVRNGIDEITEAITTTLSSYLFQREEDANVRVLVGGGGSLTAGFYEALRQSLSPEIELARLDMFESIELDVPDLSSADKDRIASVMPEALALALSRWIGSGPRHVVNLLSGDAALQRQIRSASLYSGAAVVVIIAGLAGLYLLHNNELTNINSQISQSDLQITLDAAQIAQLSPVAGVRTTLTNAENQVRAVLTNDVNWSVLITKLNSATPNDVWWTNFSGISSSGSGPATVSFGAMGCSQQSPSHWINGIGSLSSILDPWVSSSTTDSGKSCTNAPVVNGASANIVTFSSTATLAPNPTPSRFQSYLIGGGIS
ncbi:pilus assembly protein PilM [Acidithrix sp. C25]|nr:pilus assembly protein PilM [Acidithrix sp. C25]CAG4931244.1 unnamed protein product [Acidithrix sp. C25]